MSVHLSDTRLAMLHLDVSRRVRHRKDCKTPIIGEVDLREVGWALEELMRRRNLVAKPRYGELTQWMIASQLGDVIVIPPKTMSAITTCRRSARKALGAPDARWWSQTLADGRVRIERMKDGAPYIFGKPPSPIPPMLASMNVNGRLTIDYRGRTFPHKFKVIARQIMDLPEAQWRYTRLVNGKIKVRRIR